MTVLRHQLLDDQGQPRSGVTAVLRLYSGNRYEDPRAKGGFPAVSDASGWLTWTLPQPQNRPGAKGTFWKITGIGPQPVIVATLPTDTTVLVKDRQVGTVDTAGDLVVPVLPTSRGTAYDLAPRGALTIVLGDSIDAGADEGSHYSAGSVFSNLCILSGQRMRWLRNSGVGGNRSFEMLARLQADVLDHQPDICLVGGMINDIGAQRTDTRDNIVAMVDRLRAAGIHPVVHNTTPADGQGAWPSLAAARAGISRHNAWLAEWAAKRGIPVLDYYSPAVDDTTGGYLPGMSDDGTHPNLHGQLVIAQGVLARGLPPVFDGTPRLASAVGDGADMLGGRGLFLSAPNGQGQAGGWGGYGAPDATFAVQADTTIPGNWQQITGGTTGGFYDLSLGTTDTSLFASGDMVEFTCRVDGTGSPVLRFYGANGELENVNPAAGERMLTGVVAGRQAVPEGCNTVAVDLVVSNGQTCRFAQVTATNLTALGVS